MPRPKLLPEWASSGANILEPSAGKKAAGWLAGERPSAQHMNWLQRTQYDYLQSLDDEQFRMYQRYLRGAVGTGPTTPVVSATGATGNVITCNPATGRVVVLNGGASVARYGDLHNDASWSSGTGITTGTSGVIWDGTYFQAFGNRIWSSPDGVTWTQRYAGAARSMAVSPGNVRVTTDGLLRSTDGLAWNPVTLPPGMGGSSTWSRVFWDPVRARFLLLDGNGTCFRSTDGLTWVSVGTIGPTLGATGATLSAAYCAGLDLFVVARGNDAAMKYSADGGATWVDFSPMSLSANGPAVFASDDLVFTRGGQTLLATRVLNSSWATITLPNSDIYGGSQYDTFVAKATNRSVAALLYSTGTDGKVFRSALMGY